MLKNKETKSELECKLRENEKKLTTKLIPSLYIFLPFLLLISAAVQEERGPRKKKQQQHKEEHDKQNPCQLKGYYQPKSVVKSRQGASSTVVQLPSTKEWSSGISSQKSSPGLLSQLYACMSANNTNSVNQVYRSSQPPVTISTSSVISQGAPFAASSLLPEEQQQPSALLQMMMRQVMPHNKMPAQPWTTIDKQMLARDNETSKGCSKSEQVSLLGPAKIPSQLWSPTNIKEGNTSSYQNHYSYYYHYYRLLLQYISTSSTANGTQLANKTTSMASDHVL